METNPTLSEAALAPLLEADVGAKSLHTESGVQWDTKDGEKGNSCKSLHVMRLWFGETQTEPGVATWHLAWNRP